MTLVETLVAVLVLSVLVLAGAAYIYHARGSAYRVRVRRAALHLAEKRLEMIRGTPYDDVKPGTATYDVRYLSLSGGNWVVSASDPGEIVQRGPRKFPMTATVQYIDVDGGTASYDALRLSVSILPHNDPDQVILLESIYAPR